MFTTDIPDLRRMTEAERSEAVMRWMREVSEKTRMLEDELYRLKKEIKK